MDYWAPKNGSVFIFPHLEWDLDLTIEKLYEIVNNLKNSLKDLDITIWDQSTYSFEVNGSWNVIFSINNNKKKYMYMLFLDKNKIYGSPFVNNEYKIVLKHRSLLSDLILYRKIEDKLIEIIGSPNHISKFSTKNLANN